MSSGTWTYEVVSSVSADRLYKAAIVDWHNLGPKIAPEVIVSATTTGDAVGSFRETNFTSVMPFSYIKERLDYSDHEKFECKGTIVEGGNLGKTLESASTHVKIEPLSDGGSVAKVVVTYKALPGVAEAEEIAKAKESLTQHIKGAEAYLLANPTAYA